MRPTRLLLPFFVLAFAWSGCAAPGAEDPGQEETTPVDPVDASPDASPTEAAKSGSARVGIVGWSFQYVPTAIVADRMNELGYEIELIEFTDIAAHMQSASQGDVEITSASAAGTFTAIDAGLDSTVFLARNMNEFVLVARSEFDSCESLDGQRVAIHSQTSITFLLTDRWFENNCPDANPSIQTVEGSENRLAGLLQDQLDASPVDIGDAIQLELERPGDFHVLAAFAEELPVLQGLYTAREEWLVENEELVKDFIRIHLDVWEEFYADPSSILPKAEEVLPEIDPEVLALMAEEYAAQENFPPDGDLHQEEVQFTIDFFEDTAEWSGPLTYEDIVDRSYLDEVLSER